MAESMKTVKFVQINKELYWYKIEGLNLIILNGKGKIKTA